MLSFCRYLKASYERLQTLTAVFQAKYAEVRDSGDLSEVRGLRIKIEEAKEAILKLVTLFSVPKSLNPYYEALRAAGLNQRKTRKEEEIALDIRQEIERQLAIYAQVKDADGQPVLNDWIKDIEENKELIYTEVAKNHDKITARIKAGMIPIVMPGRSVQERTWEKALKHLKPIWIENGAEEVVCDGYFHPNYATDSTNKMTRVGFFKNIPDQPYLVWVKPTQKPDSKTCRKSFDKQIEFYQDQVRKNPDLYDQTDLIPTEYAALQAIFTTTILEIFRKLEGSRSDPTDMTPLDSSSTTRFLSAEKFSDRFVPSVNFFFGTDKGLYFDDSRPGEHKDTGFRQASRT